MFGWLAYALFSTIGCQGADSTEKPEPSEQPSVFGASDLTDAEQKASVLPFIADDYETALAEAKRRDVPLFIENWAPW